MTKFFTLVFVALAMQVAAQNYPITSINISLPANPDANIANWGTGTSAFVFTATAKQGPVPGRVDPTLAECKILVIIKKSGAKICGAYTSGSAPVANFNALTKVWSGAGAVSFIGQDCTLPPGDYELSVQFFGYSNGKTIAFSDEKTKPFTVKGNDQQAYQPPAILFPARLTVYKQADIIKPITFRWTPVAPRPTEPVTYRLRVWQLMQGQTGPQAIKVNQPIITKDVDNLTQAVITNIITGPCKPPYMCDFVWSVQALNREGKPIGGNNGTSETFSFNFQQAEEPTVKFALLSPANKSIIPAGEPLKFAWTEVKGAVYNLKITEIKEPQSPEEGFRTNKPIFEKDSLNGLRTNKPIFEKDSLNGLRTNKPIFEKDSLPELPLYNLPKPLKPGSYAWTVIAFDTKGKELGQANAGTFTVQGNKQPLPAETAVTGYTTIKPGINDKVISVADVLRLQIENNYASGADQITYTITNTSTRKTTAPLKADVKKGSGIIAVLIAILLPDTVVKGETGVVNIADGKNTFTITFKKL